MLIYDLLIQTVLLMKSNQQMFMTNSLSINTCFTLVNFNKKKFHPTNKIVIGKMKDEYKGIPINKFVGLKSKRSSVVSENTRNVVKQKQ